MTPPTPAPTPISTRASPPSTAPARTGPRTMAAAVLTGARRLEIVSAPPPEPGPGAVRVRVEGCGVCGSNLPVWEGRPWFTYPRPPGSPGHEGWGRIDALGDGVTGWRVGDRVALLSEHAFAEYDVAPAPALVALPSVLDGMAVPGEALACAVNVLRRAAIGVGETVAVVGVGFLGAVIVQLAVRAGARVLAVSRRPFARAVARACGAEEALDPADDDVVARLVARAGGRGADCAIEATGLQRPLDLAAECTRVRGRLVIAGYHQDGPRQVNLQLWNWRGLDVINAHERDPAAYVAGMRAAVTALVSGTLDAAPLYTHRVSLARLDQGLELLRGRPEGFLKVLVEV